MGNAHTLYSSKNPLLTYDIELRTPSDVYLTVQETSIANWLKDNPCTYDGITVVRGNVECDLQSMKIALSDIVPVNAVQTCLSQGAARALAARCHRALQYTLAKYEQKHHRTEIECDMTVHLKTLSVTVTYADERFCAWLDERREQRFNGVSIASNWVCMPSGSLGEHLLVLPSKTGKTITKEFATRQKALDVCEQYRTALAEAMHAYQLACAESLADTLTQHTFATDTLSLEEKQACLDRLTVGLERLRLLWTSPSTAAPPEDCQ